MRVFVTGWRSNSEAWLRAQQVSAQDLPRLSEEQKDIAKKFGASEQEYARNVYATELCLKELAAKTERFGDFVETVLRAHFSDASVQMVELRTFDGKFQVVSIVMGRDVRFRIEEDLVDDLLASDPKELKDRLVRMVDFNLPASRVAKVS